MLDYRLMTIDDYEAAYDLWIRCGNGLNNKDDSREGIENFPKISAICKCILFDSFNA